MSISIDGGGPCSRVSRTRHTFESRFTANLRRSALKRAVRWPPLAPSPTSPITASSAASSFATLDAIALGAVLVEPVRNSGSA